MTEDYTYEVVIDGNKYRVQSKTELSASQAENEARKAIGFTPVNPLNLDVKGPDKKPGDAKLLVDQFIQKIGGGGDASSDKLPVTKGTGSLLGGMFDPGKKSGFNDPNFGRKLAGAKGKENVEAERQKARKAQLARGEITSNPNPNAPKHTPDEIDSKYLEGMTNDDLAKEVDKRNAMSKQYRSPQTYNDYLRALNAHNDRGGILRSMAPGNISENLQLEARTVGGGIGRAGDVTGTTPGQKAGAALNIASWVIPIEEIVGKALIKSVGAPLMAKIKGFLSVGDFDSVNLLIKDVLPPKALQEAEDVLRKAEGEVAQAATPQAEIATASADTTKSVSPSTPVSSRPKPAEGSKKLPDAKTGEGKSVGSEKTNAELLDEDPTRLTLYDSEDDTWELKPGFDFNNPEPSMQRKIYSPALSDTDALNAFKEPGWAWFGTSEVDKSIKDKLIKEWTGKKPNQKFATINDYDAEDGVRIWMMDTDTGERYHLKLNKDTNTLTAVDAPTLKVETSPAKPVGSKTPRMTWQKEGGQWVNHIDGFSIKKQSGGKWRLTDPNGQYRDLDTIQEAYDTAEFLKNNPGKGAPDPIVINAEDVIAANTPKRPTTPEEVKQFLEDNDLLKLMSDNDSKWDAKELANSSMMEMEDRYGWKKGDWEHEMATQRIQNLSDIVTKLEKAKPGSVDHGMLLESLNKANRDYEETLGQLVEGTLLPPVKPGQEAMYAKWEGIKKKIKELEPASTAEEDLDFWDEQMDELYEELEDARDAILNDNLARKAKPVGSETPKKTFESEYPQGTEPDRLAYEAEKKFSEAFDRLNAETSKEMKEAGLTGDPGKWTEDQNWKHQKIVTDHKAKIAPFEKEWQRAYKDIEARFPDYESPYLKRKYFESKPGEHDALKSGSKPVSPSDKVVLTKATTIDSKLIHDVKFYRGSAGDSKVPGGTFYSDDPKIAKEYAKMSKGSVSEIDGAELKKLKNTLSLDFDTEASMDLLDEALEHLGTSFDEIGDINLALEEALPIFERAGYDSVLVHNMPSPADHLDGGRELVILKGSAKPEVPVTAKPLEAKAPTEKVPETQAKPGSARVQSGDKLYDLEGDALGEYNKLLASHNQTVAQIKARSLSGSGQEEIDKALKAEGMRFAADKRALLGNQTEKELTLSKQFRSNEEIVLPDGRTGTYHGTTFGKAKVMIDGATIQVPHSDLIKVTKPPLKGINEVPMVEKVKLSSSEVAQKAYDDAVLGRVVDVKKRLPDISDEHAHIIASAEIRSEGIKPPDPMKPTVEKPKTISSDVLKNIDAKLDEIANRSKPKKPPGGLQGGSVRIPVDEIERIALLAVRAVVATGEKVEIAIRRLLKQEGFGDEDYETVAKAFNDHADFFDIPVEKAGFEGRVTSDFGTPDRPGGLRNVDFLSAPADIKRNLEYEGKTYHSWDEARAEAEDLLTRKNVLDVLGEAERKGRGMSDVERVAAGLERDKLKGELISLQGEIDAGQGLLSSADMNLLQDKYNSAFDRFGQIIRMSDRIGSQNGRNLAAHKALIDLSGVEPETLIRRAKVIAKRDLTDEEMKNFTKLGIQAKAKSAEVDKFYEKRMKEAIDVLRDSKKDIPDGNLENC
jgi:hypothetical protein